MAHVNLEIITDDNKNVIYVGEVSNNDGGENNVNLNIYSANSGNLLSFLEIIHDFEVSMDSDKYKMFREMFSRLYQIAYYGRDMRFTYDTSEINSLMDARNLNYKINYVKHGDQFVYVVKTRKEVELK